MPFVFLKPEFFTILILVPVIWVILLRVSRQPLSRSQLAWTGGMRTLLVMILAVILADPRMVKPTDRVNLFFCLDISDSIAGDEMARALSFIRRTTHGMSDDDHAGLIVFAREPSVEIDLTRHFEVADIQSSVNRNYTDLAKALQTAIGKMPLAGTSRIVLLSDGNSDAEGALDAAYSARAMGMDIHPVAMKAWYGRDEVYLRTMEAPESTPLETPFEINIMVMSGSDTTGELIILRNDVLYYRKQVQLKTGQNRLQIADRLDSHGLYTYRAVINAENDTIFENNENIVFVRGSRKSDVLYLAAPDKALSPFVRALNSQGVNTTHRPVQTLSLRLNDLTEFGTVILDNVPAHALTLAQMDRIDTYVKDMGGGLIMIGGDQSFGAGKYGKTPIEKLLPVAIDMPSELEYPGLVLVIVMDKSSSMTGRLGDESKLEMAKIAAFAAAERLNPVDLLGIIAFDMAFQWVMPVGPVKTLGPIARRLSMLAEDGGTTLFPALEEAFTVLKGADAAKKHMIILSDGLIEEADFQGLVADMREANITISTVAIGTDSDIDLMASIAGWGGGRSYFTNDARTVPKIFVDETRIASEDVLVEQPLHPRTLMKSDIISGLTGVRWPMIQGQVVTYPKPSARVILGTEQGPLLAVRQYGLGHTAAFTSDLAERWQKEWVLWDQYSRFISQLVKWTHRKDADQRVIPRIERHFEEGVITVDILDRDNRYVNLLNLKANVSTTRAPGTYYVTLDQIAPGRYQGEFPVENSGEYYLNLYNDDPSTAFVFPTIGYGVPFSAEFIQQDTDTALLKQLAGTTGGKLMDLSDTAPDLFTADTGTHSYETRLWPVFAVIFLSCFVLEIAGRKWIGLINLNKDR
ncbi:MAG: VWA domain-containing protein [Desulfobacteraceae bacterium]|nr:VWA domain-containing protein [Desulfobacteraceae bacterium]